VATRAIAFVLLLVSIACVAAAWVYWKSLSWPLRIVVDAVPILFLAGGRDIRRMFTSYARYRREWEESAAKTPLSQ